MGGPWYPHLDIASGFALTVDPKGVPYWVDVGPGSNAHLGEGNAPSTPRLARTKVLVDGPSDTGVSVASDIQTVTGWY